MRLRKNQSYEKSFEWVGGSLRRRARDRRQESFNFFSAFKYGTIHGGIGDYVLISNFDAFDPDTMEGCDVAKIVKLYESAVSEEPFRAVVHWYSRPQQLPKKFSLHKMPFPQFDYNCEVVEDKRNFDNDVNIETIFSKCQVIQAMPDENPKEVLNSYGSALLPTFVVRFQFWASKGKQGIEILPMSLKEDSHGMEVDSGCDSACSSVVQGRKNIIEPASNPNQKSDGDSGLSDRPVSPEVVINSGEPRMRFILLSNRRKADSESSMRSDKESERSELTSSLKLEKPKSSPTASKSAKRKCLFASVNDEVTLKPESRPCLKDKDIFGLLDSYNDESNAWSDADSGPEEEMSSSDSCTNYGLPKTFVKLEKIAAKSTGSGLGGFENPKGLFISSTNAYANMPDEQCGILITPTRKTKMRPKKDLDDHMEVVKDEVKNSQFQSTHSQKTILKNRTTPKTIPKCLSAQKRIQLLSDVVQGGVGLTVRGKSAGPIVAPSSPLDEARARLHVSSVPSCLPCREQEFSSIYSFVEDKILDGAGGCMYICGVPGTGKTATAREVVRQLQEASSKGEIPTFEFGEVNGMRVTEPRRAYSEVLRVLTGRVGVAPEEACELLDRRFSRPAPRRLPTLLLIDELDLLWTKRQDVVYNLMDWPNRDQSRLVVITIANTMDLPERILMGRVSSRLGLTRLTFHPYTFQQLQEIVMSRMKGLNAFDPDAVQLVARKVAAVSGDARRALDICRRATEIAESELALKRQYPSKSPKLSNLPDKAQSVVVTMMHVDQAVSEMISSSKAKAIQCCSRLEKLFLQAIAAEVERTGVEETSFERVHAVLGTLCTYNGFRRPTVSETMSICWHLGSLKLILTEAASHADILQRIMLNVDVDSVHYALKVLN